MNIKGKMKSILMIGIVSIFICSYDAFNISSANNLLIIANKSVPVYEINKEDLKAIFLSQKTKWSDKGIIVFVTLSTSEIHKMFLKQYIGRTTYQYQNYWKRQIFTGKGQPPKSFKTEDDLIEYVIKTRGAIGYASRIPEEYMKDIKIITIKSKRQ